MRTVIFVVALALRALQACPNLRADTNTISNLNRGDLGADFDGFTNDFVANSEREVIGHIAPASSNGMDIAATDTAGFLEALLIV